MDSHKIVPLKDRWQPNKVPSEQRPRASSTGRLRSPRKNIVQDIYDRLGVKRDNLQPATGMIPRAASLDEHDSGGSRYNRVALDAQDSNVNEIPQLPRRLSSTLKSRWPPKIKGSNSEAASPPPSLPPLETSKTRTTPSRRVEDIAIPSSPGGSLLKFQSLSPALRKRLQQRSTDRESAPPTSLDHEEREEAEVAEKTKLTTIRRRGPPPIQTDIEEEKKEDDAVFKASSSVKDRLRAYKSTTTPREIASYRQRPPLIDIYSGSTTSPCDIPKTEPVETATPVVHNRNASNGGVASAFLAAIQTPRQSSTSYVPETIVQTPPDGLSETGSVSMLSSTSDAEPVAASGRIAPTVSMHKKIQWLEQRVSGPPKKSDSKKATHLPADLERLVDERVKLKLAEAEQKLEERLRLYIDELHSRRGDGMWM